MKRLGWHKMLEAEFDLYADKYRDQHQASVAFGGFDLDYFAAYKAEVAAEVCSKAKFTPATIMDFGSGVGNATWPLREAFPGAAIKCVDVSDDSLQRCSNLQVPNTSIHCYDGQHLPFQDHSIDMAFTACVFHHIDEDQHVMLLKEIRRCLAPNGKMVLFEHNPFNPLTRLAVDENAVLISAREMKRRFRMAGFSNVAASYRIFFPGQLSSLRQFEPFLGALPVGGQYYVSADA
jgi:ubiquinone/menaquinone biosynthesis C-methylase UbiE